MVIDVLISTIDSGIEKISNILLPFRKDVKYIVSHQYRNEKYLPVPKELLREDVLVSQIPGEGLTKSRNNAIRLATADICVIADDDVRYTNEYFDNILSVYNQESDVDIACFKIFTGENEPEYKEYPLTTVIVTDIHDYSPSSIEITFKLNSIKNKKIVFDERFGLGTWLIGGEEELFTLDAIKAGLKIKFFPSYIVQHPFESTAKATFEYDNCRIQVVGAMDARTRGLISIPKAFAGTVKILPDLIKNKKNPIKYFQERLSASIYILRSDKQQ